MTPSLDDVVGEVTARTQTVMLCTRGDLLGQLAVLEEELAEAGESDRWTNEPDKAPDIARRIAELSEEAKGYERKFVFASLGRGWRDLIAEHPPTDDERKQRLDHHPDTFIPAAIAASMVEPSGASVEAVGRLEAELPPGAFRRLWLAALAANVGDMSVPFSASASVVLRRSARSATTPPPEESLEASSSAEL